jgi:hypothetical protein
MLISATFLWKKSKILTSIPKKIHILSYEKFMPSYKTYIYSMYG